MVLAPNWKVAVVVFGEVINEGRRGKVKLVILLNEKVRFGEEGGKEAGN